MVEFDKESLAEQLEQNSPCLIRKLFTDGIFNVVSMKNVFKNVRKPAREVDKNLFSFQLFSKADRDFVINDGPWVFEGYSLLTKTNWEGAPF